MNTWQPQEELGPDDQSKSKDRMPLQGLAMVPGLSSPARKRMRAEVQQSGNDAFVEGLRGKLRMPICSGCKQEKLVTLKANGLCNECLYEKNAIDLPIIMANASIMASKEQRLAQELDGFLRMAITALSASFHGVHKGVPIEQAIRRGQVLALSLWDALLLFKDEQSGEQWASMKIDAVAYAANMMAHNHDLPDTSIINDAIECAMAKWAIHQAWREKQQ